VEAVEGERGPAAVSDQLLEASAVGSLDGDAGVETESTALIPAEHVLGVVGLHEAVAAGMPHPAGADGVLETVQKLVAEGGDFVEVEASLCLGRLLISVTLNPPEESV